MNRKRTIQSWEISDTFWDIVKRLIPKKVRDSSKEYKRIGGGGRKPLDSRKVFEAIVYVLRTGIQWKALPKQIYGSPSSIHKYFREWEQAGFFCNIWMKGLAEYEDLQGIAWKWQSLDGSTYKAPLAQESSGANPTDRGKKRNKAAYIGRRKWSPVIHRRNRSQ